MFDGMRGIHRLSARTVQTAKPGRYADGGGLYLFVSPTGGKSWIFRYQRDGKRHDLGLGSVLAVTLGTARRLSAEYRERLALGEVVRQVDTSTPEWGFCADSYIESHRAGWKNGVHARQWAQSLADYGPRRTLPIDQVTVKVVMDCLLPIWTAKPETASRLRGRIERIWDWAKVSGYVSGENPARWRGHLDKLLPRTAKVKKRQHFRAMPYQDIPAFMARLKARKAPTAKALRFTILTAARTSEVTGFQASEVEGDIWTIPAHRMKGGRPHRVPLSKDALEILQSGPTFEYSENGMLYLLKRMHIPYTVHGFRSSFRDWAAEQTSYPAEVVEMALAHAIKNKTEAAYRRGDLLEKRRQLMEDWARFCSTD